MYFANMREENMRTLSARALYGKVLSP